MDRRAFLRRTGTMLGVGGLAGCVGDPPDLGGTETDVPPPGEEPALADRTFEVTKRGCGNEVDEATVSFRGDVVVTGTITGSDACKTARLVTAEVRDGAFHVLVGTTDESGADVCAQCLTEIDYEAGFEFEGELPEKVVVEHESLGGRRTVATASN